MFWPIFITKSVYFANEYLIRISWFKFCSAYIKERDFVAIQAAFSTLYCMEPSVVQLGLDQFLISIISREPVMILAVLSNIIIIFIRNFKLHPWDV